MVEAGTGDPVLDLLLDPTRLSEVVGRPVSVTRVRPKPGVSHVAALRDGRTGHTVGWVQALVGEARVKRDKSVRRAAEYGWDVGEADLPGLDATLVWGPVGADPRLVRALAVDLDAVEVLRYNPLRRIVLRAGDHAVRITADPHRDRLNDVTSALADHGLPVQQPVRAEDAGVPGGRRTSVWAWVEGHDLGSTRTPAQLVEAGALLAQLHRIPPAAVGELPRRGWPEVRESARASVELLTAVAPAAGDAAQRVFAALPADVPEGPDVVLHGDFSLDQCFAGDDGLVLGDLDRVCRGPAQVDLASALAVALVDGTDLDALLEGYAASTPSGPWVAAALLSRIAEPWRAQDDGWADEVARRAGLVLDALRDDAEGAESHSAEPESGGPEGAGPERTIPQWAWLVPAAVADRDGDRVQVLRAWPDKVVDGIARVAVEGPDEQGLLRAGTVDRSGRVRLLPAGQDPRLPALAEVAQTGRLVVHRAGRRAVLALPGRYVKVLRPGRAAGVAEAAETGRRLATGVGIEAPRVLASDDGTVTFDLVPGRSVHNLSTDPGWELLWGRWAEAWTLAQAQPGDGLPRHAPADEAEVLRTWERRASTAGVLEGTPWLERLRARAADLDRGGEVDLVPTHRDLHDKQLLWDGDRLAVLDFDTACAAEPALDLANLAVHARLRHAQGRWSAAATQVVLAAVEQVRSRLDVPPTRMRLAERATVARLAAVYAFRPPWREVVLRWAEREWGAAGPMSSPQAPR